MQGTAPPWAPRWWRVLPRRVPEFPRDELWGTPQLSLYAIARDRRMELYRLEGGLGRGMVYPTAPTPAPDWLQSQFRLEPWRLHAPPPASSPLDYTQSYRSVSAISAAGPAGARPGGTTSASTGGGTGGEWGAAALGWAGGTLLLALFVLLVRAAERCLDRKLFKSSRRASEEWQTPDVLATRHQHANDAELGAPPGNALAAEGSVTVDLPPPYSECASTNDSSAPKFSMPCEDPPPPYSACYVAFLNPKDGIPSVYIGNRRSEDGSSSSDDSNGQVEVGTSISSDTIERHEVETNSFSNRTEPIAVVIIRPNDANGHMEVGTTTPDNANGRTEVATGSSNYAYGRSELSSSRFNNVVTGQIEDKISKSDDSSEEIEVGTSRLDNVVRQGVVDNNVSDDSRVAVNDNISETTNIADPSGDENAAMCVVYSSEDTPEIKGKDLENIQIDGVIIV